MRHGRTTLVKDADHVVLDVRRVVDTGIPHELIVRGGRFAHFARGDMGHGPRADGTGNTDQTDTEDEGAEATMAVEMADA